jgi:hypothetical protein
MLRPRVLPASCTQQWNNGRWNLAKNFRPSGAIKSSNRDSKAISVSDKPHSGLNFFYADSSAKRLKILLRKIHGKI